MLTMDAYAWSMQGGRVPLEFERLPEDVMRERATTFRDSLRRRRTVREFSTEPVPFDVVMAAIQAAASAPSGANRQPWTFVTVTDPGLKRRIREAAEEEERQSYEGRMPDEWLAALEPLGTDWHKPHLEDAPVLIVVFEQTVGIATDGSKVKHYYAKESVGIAVGFLLAALHLAGLATLTHTPSPMGFLREALGRPPTERPFVLVPVGYPADGATVPAITKKPLDEVLLQR
jgi:iodotyrosine deiodinase